MKKQSIYAEFKVITVLVYCLVLLILGTNHKICNAQQSKTLQETQTDTLDKHILYLIVPHYKIYMVPRIITKELS